MSKAQYHVTPAGVTFIRSMPLTSYVPVKLNGAPLAGVTDKRIVSVVVRTMVPEPPPAMRSTVPNPWVLTYSHFTTCHVPTSSVWDGPVPSLLHAHCRPIVHATRTAALDARISPPLCDSHGIRFIRQSGANLRVL